MTITGGREGILKRVTVRKHEGWGGQTVHHLSLDGFPIGKLTKYENKFLICYPYVAFLYIGSPDKAKRIGHWYNATQGDAPTTGFVYRWREAKRAAIEAILVARDKAIEDGQITE